MSSLTDQQRDILSDKAIAHIGVVDGTGRPHVSAVWIDVEPGDRLVVNTAEGRVKGNLLQVGTPVAISATRPGNDYEHVLVHGTVTERTTDGADAVIDALAKKYLDEDSYPFRKPDEVRVTVRIDPS